MLSTRSSKNVKQYQRLTSQSFSLEKSTIPVVQFGTIPKNFKPTTHVPSARTSLVQNQPAQPIARVRLRTHRSNPTPANGHVEQTNRNHLRGQNQLEFVKPNSAGSEKRRKIDTRSLTTHIEPKARAETKPRTHKLLVDPQVHPNAINPAVDTVPRKKFYKKMRIPFIN